ncbi:hypothetical protein [Paraburkholderia sp.]|uniref:hypothetical protein n=1 Tax=Paraburkholderia sp. TaxID=1926495 RepID=UPI0025FD635E|nr:hypothetical protein [Paraburkholderia sp.]
MMRIEVRAVPEKNGAPRIFGEGTVRTDPFETCGSPSSLFASGLEADGYPSHLPDFAMTTNHGA